MEKIAYPNCNSKKLRLFFEHINGISMISY